jgi:hypothetical protein
VKVYVSGPMTGIPDFNYPAFEWACRRLRSFHYVVISPHEINPADGIEHPWDWYLRRDIVGLLDAEAVVVLNGWEASKGAALETYIARALGMPVWTLATVLDHHATAGNAPLIEVAS